MGRIGRSPGWRDYEARTMNDGSEHLNSCSQWVRVELQTGNHGKSNRLPSRSTTFPPLPRRHWLRISILLYCQNRVGAH